MTDNDMSGGAARTAANGGSSSAASQGSHERETKASFSDVKRQAADDLHSVRDKAVDQAHMAADKAVEYADKEKNFAARQLGGVAEALEKVGDEMRTGDSAEIGRYARDIGSSLKSLADDVQHKDVGEIAAMAEDFGRRQPLAFLGAAALAGLAASRFVTASQRRRERQADRFSPTGGYTAPQAQASASPIQAAASTTPASAQAPSTFGKDRANVQY